MLETLKQPSFLLLEFSPSQSVLTLSEFHVINSEKYFLDLLLHNLWHILWCVDSLLSLVHYKNECIFFTKITLPRIFFLYGPLQKIEGINTLASL